MGHFYGTFIEAIGVKAPGIFSGSIRSNNFWILLLERPKTSICIIYGFMTRRTPYLWIRIYRITLEIPEKDGDVLNNIICVNIDISKIDNFENVGKDATRT